MSETLAKASRGCRFCRRRPHGVDYTTTHLEAPTLRDSPLVSSSREEKTRHEDANPVLISHWSPRSESDRIFSRYYLPRRFCARLRPVFLIFNECSSKHSCVPHFQKWMPLKASFGENSKHLQSINQDSVQVGHNQVLQRIQTKFALKEKNRWNSLHWHEPGVIK